jgi:hypothetical protein
MVRWIFVKDDPIRKPGFPVQPPAENPAKS